MTTTSELIDGLVDIDSENTENRYSKNIDYYQKYIDLLKENKDLETEKENYKFDLTKYREILEPTYNEKNRKLKEKNKIITQEKEFYFDNFTKYQKEIEPKYKEKINSLTQDLSNCERELLQCKEAEIAYNSMIIDLKERHNYDRERINNLEKDLKQSKDYAEKKTIELETDVRSKAVMIEAIEKLNRELQVESANIKKEVPSYHFCLSDSVQLSADINSLQDKLERYVTTLKGSIKIDNNKIQGLYGKYNLDTQNLTDKVLMKSVLQRHVLEKIFEYIDNYLEIKEDDDPNHPNNQEKYIMYHANKLIFLLDKFYNNHFKEDNNNTKKQYMHPFVVFGAKNLNQLMTGYRYIKDDTKRKSVENFAENLIKDVVRIFKFRLLVQEPKCETLWFKDDEKINIQFMKGQWGDDCLDDYVVDICYFPLIGTELNDSSKTKDHESLNDELQDNSSSIINDMLNKLLTTPSYSTPSQNSDNNDRSNDPNKRQHSVNNKDPDNRQNSANSNRNNDSYRRQSSTNNDRNRDLDKRQNSANSDRSNSDCSSDPNKHQNSANSDHDRDSNKRQNSVNSDHNSDPIDTNSFHNQQIHSRNSNNQRKIKWAQILGQTSSKKS
nr:6072_t:CDS:2 [Entrophospora candida]